MIFQFPIGIRSRVRSHLIIRPCARFRIPNRKPTKSQTSPRFEVPSNTLPQFKSLHVGWLASPASRMERARHWRREIKNLCVRYNSCPYEIGSPGSSLRATAASRVLYYSRAMPRRHNLDTAEVASWRRRSPTVTLPSAPLARSKSFWSTTSSNVRGQGQRAVVWVILRSLDRQEVKENRSSNTVYYLKKKTLHWRCTNCDSSKMPIAAQVYLSQPRANPSVRRTVRLLRSICWYWHLEIQSRWEPLRSPFSSVGP